jgi:hypothetical protein
MPRHPDRSASEICNPRSNAGAEWRDPENVCSRNAASGRSHETASRELNSHLLRMTNRERYRGLCGTGTPACANVCISGTQAPARVPVPHKHGHSDFQSAPQLSRLRMTVFEDRRVYAICFQQLRLALPPCGASLPGQSICQPVITGRST